MRPIKLSVAAKKYKKIFKAIKKTLSCFVEIIFK